MKFLLLLIVMSMCLNITTRMKNEEKNQGKYAKKSKTRRKGTGGDKLGSKVEQEKMPGKESRGRKGQRG